MEPRDSLHQQPSAESSLGSARGGGKLLRLPLLPFERELVATLGCTEAEYRAFTVEAMKRSRVRPAEYDHIPVIQNGPFAVGGVLALTTAAGALTTFGALAIGVALSALGFLLTPKPKQQGQGQTQSRQLPSVTGADRFSATSGFDTQADLANYGDPVPIIFGQYTGETGGILAAPSLVWSRAFSYGSQQGVKLLFVVGEQGAGAHGIGVPDLNGIFLGNSALDAIYEHNFAFYWKRDTNTVSRIRAENLRYGTRGTLSSGDTQALDDIFHCQTLAGQAQPGFCQTYTPSANTQFGAYSAIPNGTDYRVNFKLVPIPHIPDVADRTRDDKNDQRLLERVKISGDYGLFDSALPGVPSLRVRGQGQRGLGRGYGRRMGITSVNGQSVTSGEIQARQVSPGDTAVFTIAPGQLPDELYYFVNTEKGVTYEGTKVTDINSEITAGRRNADELLQLGETVMIGRTVWVVESRALSEWEESERQSIGLRCVEIFGEGIGASIGLVSEEMITRGIYNDDNGTTNAGAGLGFHAGAGFYPLLRVAFGVVRNSRECEVTEIGLRSQVWNRANGLCNFQALPSVDAFREAEINGVGINSGAMTLYLKRTSVWTVWLRPSGTDSSGQEFKWQPLGEQFCVTGETPQNQFNFIRITHPQRNRYEFKMVPKSGADVARHSPDNAVFWRLDAKSRTPLAGTFATPYGAFSVLSFGQLVTKSEIIFNPEMAAEASIVAAQRTVTIPSIVDVNTYLPDTQNERVVAKAVEFVDWLPSNVTQGRWAATMYELFGRADYTGLVRTADRTVNLPNNSGTIVLRFQGVVDTIFPLDHPFFPGFRQWSLQSITVVASKGGFNIGQVIAVNIPVTPGNPRAAPYGLTSVGMTVRVTQTSGATPIGRQAGFGFELLGNAEAFATGTRQEGAITQTTDSNTIRVVVSAVVTRTFSNDFKSNFPGVTATWTDFRYAVDESATGGTWAAGDKIVATFSTSQSNPFRDDRLVVPPPFGVQLVVLALGTLIDPQLNTTPRLFESNSQVNDVSFYNSLLSKSNESGPEHEIVYVNEMVSNPSAPQYSKLTTAGLALKASRNFNSLNQLRVWLANGISVRKFQLDVANEVGPSNKFTDLVYYLLTDKTAGAGNIVSPQLIDTEKLPATSQFLKQNKLFFDGAIDQPTNIRQFISDLAPFFLCSFVISNGRFSIIPAVPTDTAGSISAQPVKIQQLFTSGNIIENSFSVEYLSTEERKNFQAVVRYRTAPRNQFPEENTLVVKWSDLPESSTLETFDMTQYCTSRAHAFMTAKYFMSLRRRVTHTIRLRTTPFGLSLAPGDYIRVITQASPYNAANNGVVDSNLNITSVTPLADGVYKVAYWNASFDDVETENMTVASGKAVEPKFVDSIFTLVNDTVSSGTYMVEQLTLSEEGLVDIVAVEFPTTSELNSLIALDLLNDATFKTEG